MRLSAFFQIFYKRFLALRVNETKAFSRNAFIVNLFGSQSETESLRTESESRK